MMSLSRLMRLELCSVTSQLLTVQSMVSIDLPGVTCYTAIRPAVFARSTLQYWEFYRTIPVSGLGIRFTIKPFEG